MHVITAAPGLWRWAVTVAATVVSIGMLDATVAAVGGLFVLWGVLGDAGPATLAVVLLASYLLWGLGLGANLRANAELLWSTGTSTDAAGMSDRVDQHHATTLLVGRNLGAASCELALALASRAYLARRVTAAALA